MNRLFKILALFFLCVMGHSVVFAKSSGKDILNQILSNTGGGYSLHTDGNGNKQGFYASTGFTYYVDEANKLYVAPQIIYNWDSHSYEGYVTEFKSLRIPVKVGYNFFNTSNITLGAYGGVDIERIFDVSSNLYESEVRRWQSSVFAGVSARFFNRFGVNVGYRYGLTSFYADGSSRAQGFDFSFNF